MGTKKLYKTYEQMFLDVLREIEPASMSQLAKALKMKNPPYSTIRSTLKKGLVAKNMKVYPHTYSVIERVVSYDM